MSDSHTGRKSQVPTSSTDNDRIKKLREKLSVAQKNLKISHDLPKDEKKFSSIVESSKSVNKMARDFLSDVTNTGHVAPNMVDKETNKYRSYVFNTGLTLDDLATFKGNNSRDRVLEQILRKVESYKENPFDSKALMETLVDKLHRNQSLYYNYIEEENVSVLRYLIGTLYQEIEALTIPGGHVEDETFGRHSQRVSALAKSYNQPPIEKELYVKRYSSHHEERDQDSEWKPLLKELKEYFNVITNGPLAGQLMNNHFDITRSLQEKLQQVEPLADQPQSTRPNSITELFRKNVSASASESFSKDNNKRQDVSYHHSKSMADRGDEGNRKLDELHNHIKDLQKENEEIKRQITSRSKSPSMERQQSQDNLLVKEELKRAIQGKEEAENECENLRREIRQLENEIAELNENQMQMNKESLAQIDNELKRARAQIVTLLDQKATVEKQAFKLKVDNEDLLDQVQACGFKLNDMANHKEILKAHIMTHENTIREKTAEIQRLNFEKSELEGKYTSLKKYEKDVDQNAKQMNILEGNINIMREELSNARNALAEAEENISNLKKERDIMMAKCETLENFDPRNVDPSILEHIAVILFTRLTQTKELNADLKNKLQKIFGDKFVNLLASLKKKLRRAETLSREYKQKYQEKLNSSVDKDHEIETLSSLLLQIQETIPRVEPGPKMASLIVLKDELERKRGTFIENVKKSTKTRENDLQELSKIYEESEEIPHDTTFNDISSPDFEGNFPMDLGKLIEENTALRSKVQDQANEISNLNAQLKFSNSVQETRRKTASRFGSNTERLAKSGRDYSSNREVEYNEEEETTRAFQNVSKATPMKATLVQILLNTLEPNTQVVKDSQHKLEQSETSPDYPLLLGEIICEAQNHPKQLDLIAVLALSKCIRTRYASHDEENQMKICHMMMKLLETVVNIKVMTEIILIFRQIVIIEFPGGVSFKVILDNFTESKLNDLDKLLPYRKFVYLKLFYKCIRGIHREKASRNNEQLHNFKTTLDQQASQCLISLMRQLMNDLSVLGDQLETLKNGSMEQLEGGLVEIFTKIRYSFFLDSAKYVFKIYSFYNLISKYSPLGDFNVVLISRHFHQIYSNIANIIISSGLINKLQTTKELENITNLIHVAEKHLMESVDHRIVKIEDLEVIFEHFVSTYFSNTDHLIFYGEKFVDYQQLSNSEYLKMVCETEIYSKMKFFEEKLLINCINTLSGILENFGDDNSSENMSQDGNASIKKFFAPKLETVLKKLLNQMFLIDVNDLYKLKVDSEEYYENINHMGDEDCQLREAGKKFLQNVSEHLDSEIIVKLCLALQNELITSPPENIREFKQLLKRESIYYLLNKLYAQAKNDINYDSFLIHTLNVDLKIQDKNFDIVKIQLLLLVQLHVQKSYTIEENLSKEIFSIIYNLVSQENPSNICLVLIALKILIHLIEIKPDFSSLIPEIALPIFSLCKNVTYMESKLTIFEFFEYSIVGNFPEYYQVIWEICEGSYKACKDTSDETINLKSKIINILIKLIEVTQIEYTRVPFIADILQEGIQDSETFDETLMQGCYNLFGKLLAKLNWTELSVETVSKLANTLQIICSIMMKRFEYIPISVVILENCLISQIPAFLHIIGKSLIEGMIIWLSDLKENVLKFFFDLAELYLLSSKENRAEFVLNIVEKVLTFANSENDSSPALGVYLSNLMRVLARLAFEDVESLYAALNSLSQKHGSADFKYTLLAKFYDFVREETVYSSYYAKKSFCFYTFAILGLYLKELEANEGIDFNKIAFSHNNVFQTDFKSLVQIFCRCLSELYAYDADESESIQPEIYANLTVLLSEDDFLIGNEYNVDSYVYLLQVLVEDRMRRFNIYSEVKNMFSKSQVILNDNECKNIIEKEIKF